ncbi:hypothetical protein R82265_HNDDMDAM_00096 [Fructobacillus cardui]|uniref:YopX family protein n=1 Tax=Fructobacillus cardui TaxID=2893170 RepID=UPI002DA043E7|nr:hypothetical protein R82265_HNDDMDAM_00096 [Fructobacillus cardui]
MRNIKFRAWHNEEERYEYLSKSYYMGGQVGMMDITIGSDKAIWEQFTGLHDKNGKEIYEGDIVKLHVVILSPDDKVGFIEYIPKFGYCINFGKAIARQEYWAANDKHDIEVIGNIHENIELLEVVNDN